MPEPESPRPVAPPREPEHTWAYTSASSANASPLLFTLFGRLRL